MSELFTNRALPGMLASALLLATALPHASGADQSTEPLKGQPRLNKVIRLMEQKKPAFGIFSWNISSRTGASVASSALDFVIIDLEHSPYDATRLENYLLGMTDKRAILQNGNLQPNVVPLVRIPAEGNEPVRFIIKQVLDSGVFGVLVPHVETADEARMIVQACRYPQRAGHADFEPEGLRGVGYGWPARQWGVPPDDYAQRADLWPLDPHGEMLLWVMIETRRGVENAKAIARTPGIGGVFIGPSDLAYSLGVPLGDLAVEQAMDRVLAVCREAGVPCGTLTSASEVKKRLQQGYQFLAVGTDGGLSAGVSNALKEAAEFSSK